MVGRSWDGVRFGFGLIVVLVMVMVVVEVEVYLDGHTLILGLVRCRRARARRSRRESSCS